MNIDLSRRNALFSNVLLLGFLGFMAWLEASHPGVYYESVQEDEALEWASFWSFFSASLVFAVAAWRQRRATGALPWFLAGLSLFCFVVAMEEISWAQRVFGHRPPDYFLAQNYQQELNVHNFASKKLRLLSFRAIILGYGVLLPLLALIPAAGRWLDRLGIVAPPAALIPSMLAMFGIHVLYPWKHTGEVIECSLGFGFLLAAIGNASRFSSDPHPRPIRRTVSLVALTVGLAFSTAWWSRNRQSVDPANLELAAVETAALKDDVLEAAKRAGKQSISNCGLHKRIYTVVQEKKRARPLTEGSFAGLVERGLPESRAEFFLDPWNSPYWIRDRCNRDEGRRVVFVYSFGPNRIRDSNRWEILGDDVGQVVLADP